MKLFHHVLELPPTITNTTHKNIPQKIFILTISLLLLTLIPLSFFTNPSSPINSPKILEHNNDDDNNNNDDEVSITNAKSSWPSSSSSSNNVVKKCNLFDGKWVPYFNQPYYTNKTCREIIDQQNCLKFGREDTLFLKWRWKPNECELPLFDAFEFLERMRGKSLAFVGDSVGKNQMHSLLCLLATVVYPVDLSAKYSTNTDYFKHWFYTDYNFTMATFWSPFLVKTKEPDNPHGDPLKNPLTMYIDQPDDAWTSKIEPFDYVIISAGQWFLRPLKLVENGRIVGCQYCNTSFIIDAYGYRMAFRSAFQAIERLKNYKGVTIMRTFSPSHFENGDWKNGGNCPRTAPFSEEEKKMGGIELDYYTTQMEEFKVASERERKRKGGVDLKLKLIDTSGAMILRPDGHPNHNGHPINSNVTVADCVHWCLPGPIDTWNELLFQLLRERQEEEQRQRFIKNDGWKRKPKINKHLT